MANPLNDAQFLLAAHLPRQLPADTGREVAFAGRSNAGKSSAINTICQRNGLARTSKTPGRTQQLVYFTLPAGGHLVDLPGYGYAEVPLDLREHWKAFIEGYFQSRQALAGLVVVMDSRHPLKPYDRQMLDFAFHRGLPAHVLLTKADKLSRSDQAKVLAQVRRDLAGKASVQLFSAPGKLGVDEARAVVVGWLWPADAGDGQPPSAA
jgi:GTP-binding protein